MENDLNFLSTREGFNTSLKHFKGVNNLISNFTMKQNLADLIHIDLDNNDLKQFQIKSILNALLIDKFNYTMKSYNLTNNIQIKNVSKIFENIRRWNLFDILISYYHPQLGIILLNPKNEEHLNNIPDGLKENELINIYVGNFSEEYDKDLAEKAAQSIINFFEQKSVKKDLISKFSSGKAYKPLVSKKREEPEEKPEIQNESSDGSKPAVSTGKQKLSPQYGITVQNELFHNGNVEAWKKIITSYETKFPQIKVLVFYDNEQIHDLNTLFKWGKVKFGTMIFFSLLGPEFNSIALLRRYLQQGASPRFEAFLKGPPNTILKLF